VELPEVKEDGRVEDGDMGCGWGVWSIEEGVVRLPKNLIIGVRSACAAARRALVANILSARYSCSRYVGVFSSTMNIAQGPLRVRRQLLRYVVVG